MGKIYAIGDIHGCRTKLKTLMSDIGIDFRKDTLVFIGDYIDRSEFSRDVIDYVSGMQDAHENVVCLLGNHEQMFMNYLEGVDEEIYMKSGGMQTLRSYEIFLSDDIKTRKRKMSARHRSFLEALLPYYETEKYIFVHAGLRPGIPLADQSQHDLLWIRHEFINAEHDYEKTVVFGHTPFMIPLIDKNKIGIDTGAVYGGKLTCIEFPGLKIYQV